MQKNDFQDLCEDSSTFGDGHQEYDVRAGSCLFALLHIPAGTTQHFLAWILNILCLRFCAMTRALAAIR